MKEFLSYERHALSSAFPDMSDEEYQDLKDSIENIGLQNPVVLFQGQVIDGWHRYKACDETGSECRFVELDANTPPDDYVIAQNSSRRSMTASQKALAFSEIYAWKRHGGADRFSPTRTECALDMTAAQIADKAGVSTRSVQQAKQVIANAAPEVVQAVKEGKTGLPKAAEIAKMPKAQQAAAIDKPMPKQEKPVSFGIVAKMQKRIDELEAENQRLRDDLEMMSDATSDLALSNEALELLSTDTAKTIKTLLEEKRLLEIRRDGLMNERNEYVRQVKALQRKADKLDKQNAA